MIISRIKSYFSFILICTIIVTVYFIFGQEKEPNMISASIVFIMISSLILFISFSKITPSI